MRHAPSLTPFVVVLACLGLARRGPAETFLLVHGGQVVGELLNKDQKPRTDYLVRLEEGGHLKLDKSLVREVVVKSEAQLWYESTAPRLANTLEAHWKMAEECNQRKLNAEREYHLGEVLKFDPEHAEARHALGYTRLEGKWQRQEDFMLRRGFVRHENRWRLPQEVEIESRGDSQGQQDAEWRKQIKLWRRWITQGRDKVTEGQRRISEIRDPRAAAVLGEMLDDDKELPLLKLLYIQVLAGMRVETSLAALGKRAMNDPDPAVRDAALAALEKMQARELVPQLVKALKSDSNPTIQRAAQILGRLRAEEATLPLIEALTTKHKQQIATGGQTSAGFDKSGGGGGGGLSMGGGAKIIEIPVNNERVLAALAYIHSGTNFGFNKDAWRRWYAQAREPQEASLRRSD